jgi:hypothetical protein
MEESFHGTWCTHSLKISGYDLSLVPKRKEGIKKSARRWSQHQHSFHVCGEKLRCFECDWSEAASAVADASSFLSLGNTGSSAFGPSAVECRWAQPPHGSGSGSTPEGLTAGESRWKYLEQSISFRSVIADMMMRRMQICNAANIYTTENNRPARIEVWHACTLYSSCFCLCADGIGNGIYRQVCIYIYIYIYIYRVILKCTQVHSVYQMHRPSGCNFVA